MTKLKGGKHYKAEPNGKGDGHFRIYFNPTVDPDYSEGKKTVKNGINKQYTVTNKRRKHILEGDPPGTGHGPNRGQTQGVFPDSWTDDQVISAIERVAGSKKSTWKQVNGPGHQNSEITLGGYDPNVPELTNKGTPIRYLVQGYDHGLKIEVVVAPSGEGIITGYVKH